MILYHFTSEQHLDSILREGLTRGDVPTSVTDGINGVWFTTSPEPKGHSIMAGGAVSSEVKTLVAKTTGRTLPEGSKYADKTVASIEVVIPSHDRRLVSWARWGRKHCELSMFESLNRTGSGWNTWFIYFGTIPTDHFASVLLNGKPVDICLAHPYATPRRIAMAPQEGAFHGTIAFWCKRRACNPDLANAVPQIDDTQRHKACRGVTLAVSYFKGTEQGRRRCFEKRTAKSHRPQ